MKLARTVIMAGVLVAGGCANYPTTETGAPPVVAKVAPRRVKTVKNFAVPVLMYHRVTDLTAREARSPLMRDLTVSPTDFEAQIKFLSENGFSFLLASEVEEALQTGAALPEKAVAITFDDGYRDNFEKAFPILQKYKASATIFMVTSNFGKPGRLTWEDVRTMHRRQVGYGSHTVTHPDLTTLPVEQLRFELRESKGVLEKGLDDTITSVAYPAGSYNTTVAYEARQAGYVAGWKKGGGPVEPRHASEMYLLPRVRVHGRTDMKDFNRKVWSGVEVRRMRYGAKPA